MSGMKRLGCVALVGIVSVALSGCGAQAGSEEPLTAEDLIGSFDSIAYDYEPTDTGYELFEYSTLVVRGEITSFGPVLEELSPVGGGESIVVQQFVIAEINVHEVLAGVAAEAEVIGLLLPYTVEMNEWELGSASVETVAYLEPFQPDHAVFEYPGLDQITTPLFILPSPQAWVVELVEGTALLPLEHELQVEAPLEEFEPSPEEWPYEHEH